MTDSHSATLLRSATAETLLHLVALAVLFLAAILLFGFIFGGLACFAVMIAYVAGISSPPNPQPSPIRRGDAG